MALMTNREFVSRLKSIATDHKTLYVLGCFGAPITSATIDRYLNAYSYNKQRQSLLQSVCNKGYFGFDCVCLIKAVLWGWTGDSSKSYGGASYTSNGVPDISELQMLRVCSDISTDFSHIEVGELLWMEGHVGVYIGGDLAVECSPAFSGDVQITACNKTVTGYNRRNWTKHGKLPWIEYVSEIKTSLPFRKLDGENIHRSADFLVRYTKGDNTATNQWGTEVRINEHGTVLEAPVYGRCKSAIPHGGYVLSGHGEASKWMLENIKCGYTVVIEGGKATVIPTGNGYVAGENIHRGADQLVIYKGRNSTGTNKWGLETVCDRNGKVIKRMPWGVGDTPIPAGGFVLSGHGKSADWLYANIKEGDSIALRDHRVVK